MIGIIDYGLGNLASVENGLDKLQIPFRLSDDPDVLSKVKAIILPGVGAAGRGMQNLKARGLDKFLRDQAKKGMPILGICLGMQLLMDKSEEGNTSCLGILPGAVKKFQTVKKVPHMGWNQIKYSANASLFQGIKQDDYYYFVHSYYCAPDDEKVIAGQTDYGARFCSAFEKDNIYGVQFHPEKSSEAGLQALKNFWNLAC